jgi:hypothetical protein
VPPNHPDAPQGAFQTTPEPGATLPAGGALPTALEPRIEQAQQAFRRDLPELLKLKNSARQWVAYAGDRRVALGRTKTELYQECLRRGLGRGTFVVRSIEPDALREVEELPDV